MEGVGVTRRFWENKRVFLTGHTGFKGSWLSIWLAYLGAKVYGFSLPPPTRPSLYVEAGLDGRIAGEMGNILDRDILTASLGAVRPEIVIHMAAQSLVRPSYADPVESFATNVMGTVHLLEAVRHTPSVRVVMIVTSDKCYENPESLWGVRECDPMGGQDPYSGSKGCAELVTSAYRRSFFACEAGSEPRVAVVSVRAGNVIGGGDWAQDRLIPDIVRAFIADDSVMIRNPEAVRPWQHVLVPLSGYLLLAEKAWEDPESCQGGWNFGPALEDAQPVRRIVERMADLWGGNRSWRIQPGEHPREATLLRLDCSKALWRLGWRSRWSLERALETTVDWYRRHHQGENGYDLALAQIERFMETEAP
ncbi:MAG: CDP-glucose 4,6-dehydratase [Magnetococcales bacterium]|nr:CDP-glucose 4,6-dehydratase [Magnetococcales bacterium]